jgi:hypothetical protein
MIELPPLPYGASPAYGYTEAEMRAYGEACARAAIEAAAKHEERLLEWQREGEKMMADGGPMFALGAWWADRPWRRATAPSSPSSSQTRS